MGIHHSQNVAQWNMQFTVEETDKKKKNNNKINKQKP
jgi:hypothetical protein